MFKRRHPLYGFRLSLVDAVVIVLTIIAIVELTRRDLPFSWMLACVVGHFFLFCNVFRLRRSYEFMWAAAFLINVTCWMTFRLSLDWLAPLLTQLPVTVAVIAAEIRSPRYHGIFARRWNPQLDEYLAARTRTAAS